MSSQQSVGHAGHVAGIMKWVNSGPGASASVILFDTAGAQRKVFTICYA